MAHAFTTAVRTAMMQAIIDQAGASAKLALYDGTRPATGAAVTTQQKLAEFTLGSVIGTAATATLTLGAVSNVNGLITGTPTWFRLTKSDGTAIWDGSVGASGSDMNMTPLAITSGQPVGISGATLTAPNA